MGAHVSKPMNGVTPPPWRLLLLLVALLAACGPNAARAPGAASPTPAPSGGSSLAALKYNVLATVGPLAYCDPDEFPVARAGGSQEQALQLYPTIRASADTYAAILMHLQLREPLTDTQKLAVYQEWKQLNALRLTGSSPPYGFNQLFSTNGALEQVSGSVAADGTVTVSDRRPGRLNCPICLTAGTLIDTPGGSVTVTAIRPGMTVWSTDGSGMRVPAAVLDTGQMQAPRGHVVLRITLADGRSVTASPGHPTADGRRLGGLRVGDRLDGGLIEAILPLAYNGFTYDLLPAGPTRAYWANGILIGSTLGS
jgi:hypothetical protein